MSLGQRLSRDVDVRSGLAGPDANGAEVMTFVIFTEASLCQCWRCRTLPRGRPGELWSHLAWMMHTQTANFDRKFDDISFQIHGGQARWDGKLGEESKRREHEKCNMQSAMEEITKRVATLETGAAMQPKVAWVRTRRRARTISKERPAHLPRRRRQPCDARPTTSTRHGSSGSM